MASNATAASFTFAQLPNGLPFVTARILTSGEAAGIMVPVVFSIFSLIAVLGLFGVMAYSAFRTRNSASDDLFLGTNVAAYFMCLLIADFLQTIGFLMNSEWHSAGRVFQSQFCVSQGAIKHFSEVAIAIWSIIIAAHIFSVIFFQLETHIYIHWATLAGGWSITGAFVVGSPSVLNTILYGPFWGIAGTSCWITDGYKVSRLTVNSLIVFFSALLCAIAYALVFLRLRGNVVVHGWWQWSFRREGTPQNGEELREHAALQNTYIKQVASEMMLYPVLFAGIVFPFIINRLAGSTSFGGTIFVDTIFSMHGLANVILFALANRHLLPFEPVLASSISAPTLTTTTAPVPLSPTLVDQPIGPDPSLDKLSSPTGSPLGATRSLHGKKEEDPYYRSDNSWMTALPTELPSFDPGPLRPRVKQRAGTLPSGVYVGPQKDDTAEWDKPGGRMYGAPDPDAPDPDAPDPAAEPAHEGEWGVPAQLSPIPQGVSPSESESEFRAGLDGAQIERSESMDRHVSQLYRASTQESHRPALRDIESGLYDRPRFE